VDEKSNKKIDGNFYAEVVYIYKTGLEDKLIIGKMRIEQK
jgi:hypothetical protein